MLCCSDCSGQSGPMGFDVPARDSIYRSRLGFDGTVGLCRFATAAISLYFREELNGRPEFGLTVGLMPAGKSGSDGVDAAGAKSSHGGSRRAGRPLGRQHGVRDVLERSWHPRGGEGTSVLAWCSGLSKAAPSRGSFDGSGLSLIPRAREGSTMRLSKSLRLVACAVSFVSATAWAQNTGTRTAVAVTRRS